MADLSALLASSKNLNSHLSRPDLPSVNLSLDQIEALSRRLVSRQPGTSTDTDRAKYLLAQAHNLISTIEEGRKETQEEFYRVLEERSQRDWEAKKKRVFEELGGRAPTPTMMAYDRVITEMNNARLRGTSYPIVHALTDASLALATDSRGIQMTQNFHVLAKITGEPPALRPSSTPARTSSTRRSSSASCAGVPGDPNTREAVALRKQIAAGAREALEEQYWDILERTVQSRPMEARLGGDPVLQSGAGVFVGRYYRNGEWEDRMRSIAGQPLWAKLFYLVRTGHATKFQQAIDSREASFVTQFRTWLESPDRKLPKAHRDHLQAVYNAHMLHSSTADPFKLALYKLMGRLEPARRSVPQVTTTTEDWLWFQLAMVDEDEDGGLRALADVLLGGVFAGVLLMCGQFERAVAALWDYQETEVEAVHLGIALAYHGLLRVPSRAETSDMTLVLSLSPASPPALSLSTLIWRYIRQFIKMDAKEAMQYVYCQVETAWELTRRIIVGANSGPAWEELVGGIRPEGGRFPGIIEQGAGLLHLNTAQDFHTHILIRAAQHAQENDRIAERAVERTAGEILRHYERANRAVGGRGRREAMEAKNAGRPEAGLDILESTDLIPLRVPDLHPALQKNLQTYLTLTMDALQGVHQRVKSSMVADANKQMTLASIRKKSRSLMVFAGILKYRMSPDVYSYLARLDVEIAL
ncbi:nucleoporin-interacting protein NIC96 [Pholiota molesta]|nr:nucleoporin-interacting protein NIC96 [Pholiota molesta]